MERFQEIDAKIQKGYEFILEGDCPGGCDIWLETWEDITGLFTENIAQNINDLDDKYTWTEFISNYVQDLEEELHNAGLENKLYHQKRTIFCRELLQWCGTDELIVSNTRRGMAEAYFEYGDSATGEQLYIEWLGEDPDWGWGYIGWSDCYRYSIADKQNKKAEEILLTGYTRNDLRDKIAVVERLMTLYKDMGKTDKVKEYKKIFSELQSTEPESSHYYKTAPITVEKTGRNEPCPCGSGKKYKKCCGA